MMERLAVGALVLPMSVLEVASLPAVLIVLAAVWSLMARLDHLGAIR